MKKVYVLFLTLLVVCICGCNNAGKDGVNLSEYEEITEGFYARADLKEEIPTIYVWVSSVADSSSQWLALLYVFCKNKEKYRREDYGSDQGKICDRLRMGKKVT